MLPVLKYKSDFEKICSTGTPVLVLKKRQECNCYSKEELLDSEPNPYCPKCFGTGYERTYITTENIRHEPQSNYYEKTIYNSTINDIRIFFMPEKYKFITTEDLIATLDENNKIISIYEVVNKEKYNAEEFVYYEIYGKKLNFLSNIEVSNYE